MKKILIALVGVLAMATAQADFGPGDGNSGSNRRRPPDHTNPAPPPNRPNPPGNPPNRGPANPPPPPNRGPGNPPDHRPGNPPNRPGNPPGNPPGRGPGRPPDHRPSPPPMPPRRPPPRRPMPPPPPPRRPPTNYGVTCQIDTGRSLVRGNGYNCNDAVDEAIRSCYRAVTYAEQRDCEDVGYRNSRFDLRCAQNGYRIRCR